MKNYLFIFILFLSLSACGEETDSNNSQSIYINPILPEGGEDNGENDIIPSPDHTIQYVTKITYLMPSTSYYSMQGAALYGATLFQFVNGHSEVSVYDIESKTHLGTIETNYNNKWHNNQATFSHTFYEEGDEFPLLYVSQILPSQQTIQVWRVVRTEQLFDLQQIQEIRLPYDNDENNLYHFNIVIDDNDEYFWLYSRNRNTSLGQISKWKLPHPHTAKVTLKEEDMLERFPIDVIMNDAQGGIMIGQRIYFVQGVPSRSDLRFHIVNVNTQEVTTFNLRDYNFKVEPEGLCFYKDHFICATNRRGIYEIYLNRY